jgi:hypothetical protein
MKSNLIFKIAAPFILCFSPLISECDCLCNCNLPESSLDQEKYTENNLDDLYDDLQLSLKTDMKKAQALYEKARSLDKNFPILVDLDDGSYLIKNINPDHLNEKLRKKHADDMLRFGICDSDQDVVIESDCLHVFPKTCKKKVHKACDPEWCKDNCDSLAFGLGFTCNSLRARWCITSCMIAVESLRRACKYCCNDGGFVQRCLWPLADYFPRCDCEDMEWDF